MLVKYAVKNIVKEEINMPRRGENIYKRKDGRWEGRYIRGHSPSGRPSMVMFMAAVIGSAVQNGSSAWNPFKNCRRKLPHSR